MVVNFMNPMASSSSASVQGAGSDQIIDSLKNIKEELGKYILILKCSI